MAESARAAVAGIIGFLALSGCFGDEGGELRRVQLPALETEMHVEWLVKVSSGRQATVTMDLAPAEIVHPDGIWRPGYTAEFTQDPPCEENAWTECWADNEPQGQDLKSNSPMGRVFPRIYGLDKCGNPIWSLDPDDRGGATLHFEQFGAQDIPPWSLALAGLTVFDDPTTTISPTGSGSYGPAEVLYTQPISGTYYTAIVTESGGLRVSSYAGTAPKNFTDPEGYGVESMDVTLDAGPMPAFTEYLDGAYTQTISRTAFSGSGIPIHRCEPVAGQRPRMALGPDWVGFEPDLPRSFQAAQTAVRGDSGLPLTAALLTKPDAFLGSWQGMWRATATSVTDVPGQDYYEWTFEFQNDGTPDGTRVVCEQRELPAPLGFRCSEAATTATEPRHAPDWTTFTVTDPVLLSAMYSEATGSRPDYAGYQIHATGDFAKGDIGHGGVECGGGICIMSIKAANVYEPKGTLAWIQGNVDPSR
ncbi:MAG: hypothetical protein AABY18_01790 [Candidatus Thermoplasmatota archaeon]